MKINNNPATSLLSASEKLDAELDNHASQDVRGDNADTTIQQSMEENPDFYLSGGRGQLSERGFHDALENGGRNNPIPISFRGDNIGYWGSDAAEVGRLWGNNTYFELAGGDDRLWTFGDNATHFGGEGNDDLRAVGDDHNLHGGDGNDLLLTQGENNTIHGDAGDDSITQRGGFGNVAYGGEGNDVMTAAGLFLPSADDLEPLTDPDRANRMYGEGGDDEMIIRSRAREGSEAYGGVGNDSLIAIGGRLHKLYGGEGSDNIQALGGTENVILDGGAGSDSFQIPCSFDQPIAKLLVVTAMI